MSTHAKEQVHDNDPENSRPAPTISCENRSAWGNPDFWIKLCRDLRVECKDVPSPESQPKEGSKAPPPTDNAEEQNRIRRRYLQDKGYCLVDKSIASPQCIDALRKGIEKLQEANLPASFILLFDETWELARRSRSMLKDCTSESNAFHFDILAWCIDGNASTGFSPHRDRQPDPDDPDAVAVEDSFKGKDAKFVTQWIALTEAKPENSCLYMIPKKIDPGYTTGDTDECDPMSRALPTKESYQHIHAMPREPGQSILFSHRVIHWASTRDPETKLPNRMAISFVCSDPSFERPYVNPSYFTESVLPPFRIRLLLVCAQLLIYYQRFNFSRAEIKAFYEFCKEHENELEEKYRNKVFYEFVKAMKEDIEHNNSRNDKERASKKSDGEDEEEAMLEEMLNAEANGYGEFGDDYDELGQSHESESREGESGEQSDDESEGSSDLFGKKRECVDDDTGNSKNKKSKSVRY